MELKAHAIPEKAGVALGVRGTHLCRQRRRMVDMDEDAQERRLEGSLLLRMDREMPQLSTFGRKKFTAPFWKEMRCALLGTYENEKKSKWEGHCK